MRKVIPILFLLQIFLLPLASSSLADRVDEEKFCSENLEKISEKKIGAYRVRISFAHGRFCQILEIRKYGHVMFRELGIDNHYYFGADPSDEKRNYMMKLTGRGRQLVVSKWTGGMHCCYSLLVFNLGNEFKKIAEIEGGSFSPELIDLNHDGIPEIKVTDDFLTEAFSSFANSAQGSVILKYSNGQYLLAEELMKRKPPSLRSWRKLFPAWRKEFKEKGPDWPPESFIQALTNLVFTGNARTARSFVERAWPKEVEGKENFLRSYKEALAESRYYAQAAKELGVP